jgi:hypothetical protein
LAKNGSSTRTLDVKAGCTSCAGGQCSIKVMIKSVIISGSERRGVGGGIDLQACMSANACKGGADWRCLPWSSDSPDRATETELARKKPLQSTARLERALQHGNVLQLELAHAPHLVRFVAGGGRGFGKGFGYTPVVSYAPRA